MLMLDMVAVQMVFFGLDMSTTEMVFFQRSLAYGQDCRVNEK